RDLSSFDEDAEPAAFDLVTTFDAIHDQAKPLEVLIGIRKTLKPGGVYLAQDIHGSSHHHLDREHPMGAFLYAVSTMHCMTVSLAQGGEGLGTMWGREKAREYFEKAGFRSVEVCQLPHDVQNDYWVLRPEAQWSLDIQDNGSATLRPHLGGIDRALEHGHEEGAGAHGGCRARGACGSRTAGLRHSSDSMEVRMAVNASVRKKKVLVTGATGFLGRNVLEALRARPDVTPIAACRSPDRLAPDVGVEVRAGDLLDAGYREAV